MNENQTSEPQHSIVCISVRVLSPADAESYRFVRLLALHEQPPAFGSLPEDEPNLSEIAAKLAESDERCFFGAFQDHINFLQKSIFCEGRTQNSAARNSGEILRWCVGAFCVLLLD